MGYPWCAFAVFLAALAHGGETAARGLRRREFNAVYTPAVLAAAKAGAVRPAGRPGRRSPSAAISFSSTGISATATLWITWGRLVEIPVDGRVRTVDGNSGGDGLVARRDRENGSVRAFVRDS